MISKAALMEALGKRFDYQSTRNVYRDALSRSGLADQDVFSAADIERFVTALKKTERRLEAVLGTLGLGPAVTAAPAAPPASKPAPVVAAAPEPEPEAEVSAEPAVEAGPHEAAPTDGEVGPEGEVAAEAAAAEDGAPEPEDDKRGKKHKKK